MIGTATQTMNVNYFQNPVSVTRYYEGDSDPGPLYFQDGDDSIFGADISTVLYTNDKSKIDHLMSLLSISDYQRLENELCMESINVVSVGDIYFVHLEIEYINNRVMDYALKNFLVVGSHYDDINVIELCVAREYKKTRKLPDNNKETYDEFFDFEGDPDMLEDAENSYDTIIEFHDYHGVTEQYINSILDDLIDVLK